MLHRVNYGMRNPPRVIARGGKLERRVDLDAVHAANRIRHDRAGAAAAKKLGNSFGRLRRGGKSDALQRVRGASLKPLDTEGQQRAALVFGE